MTERSITCDAGALIALDRNDRRVISLLEFAQDSGYGVIVPSTALAQALRNPSRQARLARALKQENTLVVPLDRGDATRAGLLLAARGASDIADAHVVVCARRSGSWVVTSDPGDLLALDPTLEVVAI